MPRRDQKGTSPFLLRIAIGVALLGVALAGCPQMVRAAEGLPRIEGPLTLEQVQANTEKHGLPLDSMGQLPNPKTFAWVLANAKTVTEPIQLTDCRGGTWVRLTAQNVGARFGELETPEAPVAVEQEKVEVSVCVPVPAPVEETKV